MLGYRRMVAGGYAKGAGGNEPGRRAVWRRAAAEDEDVQGDEFRRGAGARFRFAWGKGVAADQDGARSVEGSWDARGVPA